NVVNNHPASISKTSRRACVNAPIISINAGGSASGAFVADTKVTGGNLAPVSTARIDRSAVSAAPAEVVYQSERWGAMSYRVDGMAPSSKHKVHLHFAEVYFSAANKRKF